MAHIGDFLLFRVRKKKWTIILQSKWNNDTKHELANSSVSSKKQTEPISWHKFNVFYWTLHFSTFFIQPVLLREFSIFFLFPLSSARNDYKQMKNEESVANYTRKRCFDWKNYLSQKEKKSRKNYFIERTKAWTPTDMELFNDNSSSLSLYVQTIYVLYKIY